MLQIGYNINTGQGKRSHPSWLGGQKMKKQDILNKVTETVRGYLNEGYTLYPKAMRGSQGEDFSIAVVKEGVGVAISTWVANVTATATAIDGYTTYEVWCETFDVKAFEKSGDLFWFQTDTRDWKLGAPVVDRLYNVNTRCILGSDWFVSEEEASKAKELHVKRLMARRDNSKPVTFRSDKAKELAAKIVSKKQGYKRVRAQHVNSISVSKNRVSGRRQIVIDLNKKVSKNASTKVVIEK